MTHSISILASLALLAVAAPAQEPVTAEAPFPASTAIAEGVSPEALAGLGELVQSLVDEEEIVGAELLVIKNGHSILHEAYGWNNREEEVPMEVGSVFCVRSMTKPFIGTAILMLIDDNELELDDRVSKYLPAFDVDGKREITVEQLLQHKHMRVRDAARATEVTLGQVERTTILTNNRAFAKVDPQATMEFDLPKRQIVFAKKSIPMPTSLLVRHWTTV